MGQTQKSFALRAFPYFGDEQGHIVRPRMNALLGSASKKPLVVVCAGAGYGKTRAVTDYVWESGITTVWVQLSARDNLCSHFWENVTASMAQVDMDGVKKCMEKGFPGTAEKLNQYIEQRNRLVPNRKCSVVYDDIHLITDPLVLRFLERSIRDMPENVTVFLLGREYPQFNVVDLDIKGRISNIAETDLLFSYGELFQYADSQNLAVDAGSLSEILKDTNGWAFSVNLVIRSLEKSPGYKGYTQLAVRQNLFKLMQMEVWQAASDGLKRFLLRLSLIKHLAAELVAELAGPGADEGGPLLAELEKQNAYVRYDAHIDAYRIHHLLLLFLYTKQDALSDEERRDTYKKAADWCHRNGFRTDAIAYYEKVGDYGAIVSVFDDFPEQIPFDIAAYARDVFERAPGDTFTGVELFAARHLRILLSLGLWEETLKAAAQYEHRALQLPAGDGRNHMLAGIYLLLGKAKMLMAVHDNRDNRYDFDAYYQKMDTLLSESPVEPSRFVHFHIGPWANMAGSARSGAPQEFCKAMSRCVGYVSHGLDGRLAGLDDLCLGELKFYQGEVLSAEVLMTHAIEHARPHAQFDIIHRALLYLIRIAVAQGEYAKANQFLAEIERKPELFQYESYASLLQFASGGYYYLLRQPQLMPGWLKDKPAPYIHAAFTENIGNQMKARYCYLTKNYAPLLVYIQELKHRESVLFGKVEMLAIEACVHFQMKNKTLAIEALQAAYETSAPNHLQMPFVELGKDMRTLTAWALKEEAVPVPGLWLKNINKKSATYAKRQSLVISDYRRSNGIESGITLSALELTVLRELIKSLSREEIATSHNLSIHTVNSVVSSIYGKLNAHSIIDAIRVAFEHKLL